MRSLHVVFALLGAAACGDNHATPDARVFQDARVDAQVPLDAFVACNYTEAHDTTNDYLANSGFVLEDTGITFATSPRTICGTINNGHFDNTQFSIDVDEYGFTLAADADLIISLTAPGAGNIANLGIYVADASGGLAGGSFVGDHGIFNVHLAAGAYKLSVEAYDNADIAAALPYKARIAIDAPATRCAKITAAANYTEANDGGANNGNDMINIDYTAAFNLRRVLTASTTDAPEPTGLTLAGGTNYRLSGSSAAVAQTGSYFDQDTYLITTGATTNQLAIRLNWPSTTADLDYYLFPAGSTLPTVVGASMALMEDEFRTTAVLPNTAYWLWVGAFHSTTNLPATYDASLCAETFTP